MNDVLLIAAVCLAAAVVSFFGLKFIGWLVDNNVARAVARRRQAEYRRLFRVALDAAYADLCKPPREQTKLGPHDPP